MSDVAIAHLPIFRAYWTFHDTCVVKEETSTVFSDVTGQYTPVYTTRYSGGCLVRPASESDAAYGQQIVVSFDHVVFLPWDAIGPNVNHLVDITSATDPKLTGKTMVIRGIPTDTLVTKRILLCQDIQGS